jgi:hypothetical protein
MIGQVIDMSTRQTLSTEESKMRQSRFEQRELDKRAALARLTEEQIVSPLTPNIRAIFAQNVHRLLSRVKSEARISRKDVASEIYEAEPSKRLYEIAHDPIRTLSDNKRARLAASKDNYIKIAKKAAELLGEKPEFGIRELVANTRYAEIVTDVSGLGTRESLVIIEDILRDGTAKISRHISNFPEILRAIDTFSLEQLLDDDGYQYFEECLYPSVFLGSVAFDVLPATQVKDGQLDGDDLQLICCNDISLEIRFLSGKPTPVLAAVPNVYIGQKRQEAGESVRSDFIHLSHEERLVECSLDFTNGRYQELSSDASRTGEIFPAAKTSSGVFVTYDTDVTERLTGIFAFHDELEDTVGPRPFKFADYLGLTETFIEDRSNKTLSYGLAPDGTPELGDLLVVGKLEPVDQPGFLNAVYFGLEEYGRISANELLYRLEESLIEGRQLNDLPDNEIDDIPALLEAMHRSGWKPNPNLLDSNGMPTAVTPIELLFYRASNWVQKIGNTVEAIQNKRRQRIPDHNV